MKKKLSAVAVALTLAACNADLKAEQEAWKRLVDHALASTAAEDSCMAAAGFEALKAKEQALWAKYEEASEASIRVHRDLVSASGTPRFKVVMAAATKATEGAVTALDAHTAAQGESAAVVEKCSKEARREPELSIRIAEYKAACGKCAVTERCEANFESNNSKAVDGKPYDASRFTFACQR